MTTLQPAWVLNRKAYGDNGLLVELFTAESGRCSAVVRGAHRRKQGGSLASLLQPFHPLLIALVGRGELKTLRAAESPKSAYVLRGDALMSGLYVNELVSRVVPRFDPHPDIFMSYGESVEALSEGPSEPVLRRFELRLLSELGYRVDWFCDSAGDVIRPECSYRFEVDHGFCEVLMSEKRVASGPVMTGTQVVAVSEWLADGDTTLALDWAPIKHITRAALGQLTAGRTLHSREIYRQLKKT
ncbi:DNA repair protein RecO [Luminiphilus sp.]|nr:DNA repair protein RecO [Luminiphilus sp.]MDA8985539.1 DNA repair protein RecO [Luminiphilus sp.]